jgi:hypothetical protein
MQQKTQETLREILDEGSFSVTRKDSFDARPTVPGEIAICDNYAGTAVSVGDGFIVSLDNKKFYYTRKEFDDRFEVVSGGMEGPGNTRECRFKGSFRGCRYSGDPFVYRTLKGPLKVITGDMYIVEEFDDFSFYDPKEFKNLFR